ncbi:MAG: PIN domain-containing protein [Thermoplasmata archaeon]|nr:MAG: PIN domain-containing protein [Thermoplasmata archaeon]
MSESDPKAIKLIKDTKKNSFVIPSVTILELTRSAIRKGKLKDLDDLISSLMKGKNIKIVDCDVKIAKKAGEISTSYNIPSIDSIIASTYIIHNCNKLLSEDSHFNKLQKNKLIKKQSW